MRANSYTATERTIVLKWLQQYPDNLKYAFEKASEEIGEINIIQETNNKVITKINNIFKDED